jgi:hypothetical protein
VVAIGFSGLLCVIISLIKPQNYDWALMKEIPTIEDDANTMMEDVSVTFSVTFPFVACCNLKCHVACNSELRLGADEGDPYH